MRQGDRSPKPFKILWWFCRGCSPLPIPNREVKPLMADGTAPQCGRVGSCHIYYSPVTHHDRAFFCLYVLSSCRKAGTVQPSGTALPRNELYKATPGQGQSNPRQPGKYWEALYQVRAQRMTARKGLILAHGWQK